MNDNKWAVIGAGLAGLAAGVALGMLFAPASGKETRQVVKEKVGKMGECAGEMARNFIHHGKSDAGETDAV